MGCSCDYDPPEFWHRATRSAKKPYRCAECGGLIDAGDRYEYVSGKWEGWLGHFRTCSRCVTLRQWLTNSLPCFCWAHGNMLEDAKEAVADAVFRAGDEVDGIRFGLGRHLVAIRRHSSNTREALRKTVGRG